jgi:hypothetical protein
MWWDVRAGLVHMTHMAAVGTRFTGSLPRACLQPEMRATAVAPTKTQICLYVHIHSSRLLVYRPKWNTKTLQGPNHSCFIVGLACAVGIIFVTKILVKPSDLGDIYL